MFRYNQSGQVPLGLGVCLCRTARAVSLLGRTHALTRTDLNLEDGFWNRIQSVADVRNYHWDRHIDGMTWSSATCLGSMMWTAKGILCSSVCLS
ncbi:hypothetical protein AVEN_141824-1 [Araneus ventricosus]|uniref:Uncharacterized protein n=1 Tax=Araneus ventricosus TaxID=182803 RepID=A0A4Y2E7M5_ARAVE|nr:hypothetical protein AVEN_141824-1 [Araneus ventricosus]